MKADWLYKMKNLMSKSDFEFLEKREAAKIVAKNDDRSPKSGTLYVVLAFCLGTLGIHNFYAGYWKRGFIQALISFSAQYFLYVPLLFTSLWAEMELLFVNRDVKGRLFGGSRKLVWLLRILSVVVLVWGILAIDGANVSGVLQDLDGLYGLNEAEQIEQFYKM